VVVSEELRARILEAVARGKMGKEIKDVLQLDMPTMERRKPL
jgi:hypothetical protein